MPHKYFFINNLGFVWNGFIIVYQDICNKLKQDPTYDTNSYRRKTFIEFRVLANIYILPPHCVLVDFPHSNHYHFPSVFNQKITNTFGIYNIWQTHTQMFNIIIFTEIMFPFFATFFGSFYSSLLYQHPLCFLFLYTPIVSTFYLVNNLKLHWLLK